MSIHTRLRELGLQLPHAAAPVASYQPVVVDGHTAYVSGQLPFVDGKLVTGQNPASSEEAAKEMLALLK